MSGTTWTLTLNGEPLTWTAMARPYYEAHREQQPQVQMAIASPLQFDVAEELSSKQAQALLLWLTSWLASEPGHGVRLVPSIPTAVVAEMAPGRLAGKPVRL